MKHLVRISLLLLSCAAGSIAIAEEPVPTCDEGQLYWGIGGGGINTAVAVYATMPPAGEQLGEFNLVLLSDEPVACHGKHGRHGWRGNILHWQGIVRGRQDEVMQHALVNTEGDGYALTSDTVEFPPLGDCAVDGVYGMLVRETLTLTEGVWNDVHINGGAIVVEVCIPTTQTVGSLIWYEVVDGTYLCLSAESATP